MPPDSTDSRWVGHIAPADLPILASLRARWIRDHLSARAERDRRFKIPAIPILRTESELQMWTEHLSPNRMAGLT